MIMEKFLRRNVDYYPNKLAVIDGGTRLSFLELYERSNQLANGLIKLGISKGNRVAIMEKNSHQYVEFCYAVAKIGAVAVMVNWRLAGKELSYILNDSEAEAIVFGEEFKASINSVQSELKTIKHYIVIGKAHEGLECYESLRNNALNDPPQVKVEETDIVFLMYTSGTTGFPKGVFVNHQNVLFTQLGQMMEEKPALNDVYLDCGVFFHMPIQHVLGFLMCGVTIVTLRQFSPEEVLRLVQEEKVTRLFLIPTMINFILEHPRCKAYDLSSLKTIGYGGMPISAPLLERAMTLFKCAFFQFFGSTEAGNISILRPEDHILEGPPEKKERLRSAGRCDLFTELKIVDDDGREVLKGEFGEIAVRSKSVTKGYWKRPEETKKVLKDDWFYTGDMGRLDDEGYLYIVDRKSDMIISGGENVYPKEIEEVISSHPAVQMAAVIGVPDEKWGESVKAIILLKEGEALSEEEMIVFCKDRLAGFKKPKSVEFVTSLPLNPAGKILKKVLREKYWKGRERRVH